MHSFRVPSRIQELKGALLLQQVEHGLIEVGERRRAQRRGDGQQRKHLLVLLQDLLVLRAALVEALHPVHTTQTTSGHTIACLFVDVMLIPKLGIDYHPANTSDSTALEEPVIYKTSRRNNQ